MEAKIIINMDNHAFDGDASIELVRILKDLCSKIERYGLPERCPILDINGNQVGQFQVRGGRCMDTELRPYRFSFTAGNVRHVWIRFYDKMSKAFANSKRMALLEYWDAHDFMIESDQDDEEIRKSWGLT